MGRPINEVIQAVINCLPSKGNIPQFQELKKDLVKIATSALYQAPEIQYEFYRQLCETLNYHIPKCDEDWQILIDKIVSDKEDYRKYL